MSKEKIRTLKDAVYGLAVGDALGLPVQFAERDSYFVDEMVGYGTFNLPPGSWSDDTSLTLATCDSLRRCGKVDVKDIRRRFEMWFNAGRYTPYKMAYDIGATCAAAIMEGKGQDGERSNGNGSLMRIIPLAFVEGISDEEIGAVSAITHAHPCSKEGCVYYVRIAKGLLAGKALKECIMEIVPKNSIYGRVRNIETMGRDEIKSSGYIVDTFEAAMWCLLTTNTYKECIIKAVNLGSDTDTVGAVAGGIAGIIYGYEEIPKEWIRELKSQEEIDGVLY